MKNYYIYLLMKKHKSLLTFIFFLVLSFPGVAQEKVFDPASLAGTVRVPTPIYDWKYQNGDDLLWSSVSFDDSKWDTASTKLATAERKRIGFTGNAWFRKQITADSGTVIGLQVTQNGASDLYFDGQLICHFGNVAPDRAHELRYDPKLIPLSIPVSKSGQHLIAIRYSNHADSPVARGFVIGTMDANSASYWSTEFGIGSTFFLSILEGFFTGLALLHFFMFFYYKAQKSNLYYGLFTAGISLEFTCVYIARMYHEPGTYEFFGLLQNLLYPCILISLLCFVHILFNRPFTKFFWFNFSIAAADLVLEFFHLPYLLLILVFLLLSISVYTVIQTAKAIIRKQDGARILGAGMLMFFISLSVYGLRLILFSEVHLNNYDWVNTLFIAFLIVGVLSIPISMSLYLARQFSTINKTIIAQEAEKKKILEGQKEELERQVEERTAEVVHQKKIIEEKNKDITDSINYAKRIQEAILPAKEIKYRIFPDSFVFFQPRDIVSGDFYWFSEKNGKKIIAAADCTGHGVPGAFMSMIGNAFLNEIVNEKGINKPSAVLDQLKINIITSLNQSATAETEGNKKVNDGMDIALCALDEQNGLLEFAGANNPLWLVRNGACIEFKADKQPVGLHSAESKPFTLHSIPVQKGDTFYVFTDGFADQFGGSKGKKFKYKQMQELILSMQDKKMSEQEKILEQTINNWKGFMEQVDDILVIGVRI
jgi:serine phosphatase RsbU (regulator of sigma subunit)